MEASLVDVVDEVRTVQPRVRFECPLLLCIVTFPEQMGLAEAIAMNLVGMRSDLECSVRVDVIESKTWRPDIHGVVASLPRTQPVFVVMLNEVCVHEPRRLNVAVCIFAPAPH